MTIFIFISIKGLLEKLISIFLIVLWTMTYKFWDCQNVIGNIFISINLLKFYNLFPKVFLGVEKFTDRQEALISILFKEIRQQIENWKWKIWYASVIVILYLESMFHVRGLLSWLAERLNNWRCVGRRFFKKMNGYLGLYICSIFWFSHIPAMSLVWYPQRRCCKEISWPPHFPLEDVLGQLSKFSPLGWENGL